MTTDTATSVPPGLGGETATMIVEESLTSVVYAVIRAGNFVTATASSSTQPPDLSQLVSASPSNAILVASPRPLEAMTGREIEVETESPLRRVLSRYRGALTPGAITIEDLNRLRSEWE